MQEIIWHILLRYNTNKINMRSEKWEVASLIYSTEPLRKLVKKELEKQTNGYENSEKQLKIREGWLILLVC